MKKWGRVSMQHRLIDDIPREQLKEFVSNASLIRNLPYWEWFLEDMELYAERKMFTGREEDLIFGKGILTCLWVMKDNINKMASGNVRVDSPAKKKMMRFLK